MLKYLWCPRGSQIVVKSAAESSGNELHRSDINPHRFERVVAKLKPE